MAAQKMSLQRKSSTECPPILPSKQADWNWIDDDWIDHSPLRITTVSGNKTVCMTTPNSLTFQTLEKNGDISFHQTEQKPIMTGSAKPMTFIQAGILYNTTIGIKRYAKVSVVITGHTDGSLSIWHGDTSEFLTTLKSHQRAISGIEIQSDFKKTWIITTSHDKTAKIWDAEDNGFNMSQTIKLHSNVLCLAISFNKKLVAFGARDRKLVVYR